MVSPRKRDQGVYSPYNTDILTCSKKNKRNNHRTREKYGFGVPINAEFELLNNRQQITKRQTTLSTEQRKDSAQGVVCHPLDSDFCCG